MITLELDEQQAWFLTQFFSDIFAIAENKVDENTQIFYSKEDDEEFTFDPDYKHAIEQVEGKLLEARFGKPKEGG
jgi:hypothetical protein